MSGTITTTLAAAMTALVLAAWIPTPSEAAPATPAIAITGASYLEVDDRTGIWRMRGNPVVVTRGPRSVQAQSITYDSRGQLITATDTVSVRDEAIEILAGAVIVSLPDEHLLAVGEVTAMVQDSSPMQLWADRFELWSTQQRTLATGMVRVNRGEVTMSCAQLAYDLRTRVAIATGRPKVVSPQATLNADRISAQFDRDELTAEGDAQLDADGIEGTAPTIVFQSATHLATLSGGAIVRQRQNELRAEVIAVDIERKRVVATGGAHVVVYPNP
jgi:lipopolysaccharide export system protein LptA